MAENDDEKDKKISKPNWEETLQETLKGSGPQLLQAAQGGGGNMLKQLGYKFGAKMLGSAIGGPVGTVLGSLFNDGTPSVPEMDFGPDPMGSGPMNMREGGLVPLPMPSFGGGGGQEGIRGVASSLNQAAGQLNQIGSTINGAVGGGGGGMRPPMAFPMMPGGPGKMPFASLLREGPQLQGFRGGTMGVDPMRYAQGVDSVPAMLTPGEAVIPAPAAQHPANKQAIEGMVQQGRAMNDGIRAPSPMQGQQAPGMSMEVMDVSGPLSGKTKREQMKLMQDMSLKKKAFMAEEKRKDEKHQLAMKQTKMKGALAMKQSQE